MSWLLRMLTINLAVQYTVGKCADVGDQCDHQKWMKSVKPIRDAVLSGNSDSLKGLQTSLIETFKHTDGYDTQICQVHYDENSKEIYSYGLDCGADDKCHCGLQLVGSPTKAYQLVWDPAAKGCRRKTGQECAKFGFIPEEQNCLTSDVCYEGTCKSADKVESPTKKMQKYPKFGDICDRSTWSSLYKPYLDARDIARSMEGLDTEESEIAEEKSTDLFRKLMNAMDANPDLYGDVCYTTDHTLVCEEDNKCACNRPYVSDPKTRSCRTATGETCFMRCTHLREDQCVSSDHCFTDNVYKGVATCYPIGVYPESYKKSDRKKEEINSQSPSKSAAISVQIKSILNSYLHIAVIVTTSHKFSHYL